VYKCQFPLTRRFIEFHEVRVRFRSNSEFSVQLLIDVPELGNGACFVGRFAERAGFLLTASWICRIEP
jgi:4'-phosphopantetheinyl transferase EntD